MRTKNCSFVKKSLLGAGFDLMGSESQIMPIFVGDSKKAVEFSRLLMEKGIFIQAIRPPTVPQGEARLRLTVMATHDKKDLKIALDAIRQIGKTLGII